MPPSNNHPSYSASDLSPKGSSLSFTSFWPPVSSPLTSSPIRSSPPRPLSPFSANAQSTWRATQSSPIKGKTLFDTNMNLPSRLSVFATRPTRPNPVVQKREERLETRRKLFLQNVKARGDEQRWQRRGGDDGILKLDFLATTRSWKASKERDFSGLIFEEDIEDLSRLQAELNSAPADSSDVDIADNILQQEEAEIEELVSSFNQQSQVWGNQSTAHRPHGQQQHPNSDFGDEEYDDIFMDFIEHVRPAGDMDVDMS